MRTAHSIALTISHELEDAIIEEPTEVLLAFAGLFCSMGVRMNVPQEDAMNLIKNVYQDVWADSQGEMH
jgi:hypothetical protein